MKMVLRSCLVLVVALSTSTLVRAHGPQLQIVDVGGKLVTREILQDTNKYHESSVEKRLYVLPISAGGTGGLEWRPNPSPGIAFEYAPSLAGKDITINFTALNATDGLLKWNGSSFVDAGLTQIQAYKSTNGNTTNSVDGMSSPKAVIINPVAVALDSHTGLAYRFLGDGVSPTSGLADGIYLFGAQFGTLDGSIGSSDPFYFLSGKNASDADLTAAALSFQTSQGFTAAQIQNFTTAAIPEPSTWGLIALGSIFTGWSYRRRNRR